MRLLLLFISISCFATTMDGQSKNPKLKIMKCTSDSALYSTFLLDLDSLGIIKMVAPEKDTVSWITISDNGEVHIDTSKIKRPKQLPARKITGVSLAKQNQALLEKSDFCSLLFYVAAFDRLLSSGLSPYSQVHLDLRFSLRYQTDIAKQEARMYRNFKDIKKCYEAYILEIYYKKRKEESFEEIINNIVTYGKYSHPNTLRKILLGEL